ncbi:MAG: hypothetical protein IJT82_03545 [Schwartzia sp.]|nr:hypothetical protein [Schwartzia sp. (in: firmicutes)]
MNELITQQESEGVEKRRKRLRGMAADYLLNYDRKRKEYEARKEDFLAESRKQGNGHGSQPGKPTETQAVASVAFDEKNEESKWLKAVEITQRGLSDRKRIFLKVRREAITKSGGALSFGRPPWRIYVQRRYSEEMRKRYLQLESWISERNVSAIWQDIVSRTVETFYILDNKVTSF